MKTSRLAPFGVSVLCAASLLHGESPLQPDKPIACDSCEAWNAKREPFKVFGNTYYVGVGGLASVLVASDSGLILLDGGLPQSAPLIADNLRSLGYRVEDIKLIVNSHAHFDHSGGIAALQRASGAIVAASAEGARALEAGEPTPDDPQYAFGRAVMGFPPVSRVQRVADGETLRVGDLAITAHLTPGHTPGSTTWTWRSCEASRCLDVVYADSLNPVSAPAFKFTAGPGLVESFRRSIAAVGGLPCDILLSVHPEFSDMDGKLERRSKGATSDPFIDPAACRAYADTASQALDRKIATEK